jgi:type I restriction enzyme R subunit
VRVDGGQYTAGDDDDAGEELSPMQQVAVAIDELYRDDASAPSGWHLKDGLRRELRGAVRRLVAKQRERLENWKDIPAQVDAFAVQHYFKG